MTTILTALVVGAVAVLMIVSGARTLFGTARKGLADLAARIHGDL